MERKLLFLSDTHIGCVPPENSLLTTRGIKSVKDYANEAIFGIDGIEIALNKSERYINETLIQIKASGIPKFSVTKNHPILIAKSRGKNTKNTYVKPSEEDLEWINAESIETNDWVVIPRLPNSELAIDNQLATIYGFLVGDGSIAHPSNTMFYFKGTELDLAILFASYIIHLPDTRFARIYKSKTKNMTLLRTDNRTLNNFMQKLGKRENRIIPEEVFYFDKNSTKYFLKGLFLADGNYLERLGRLSLTSTSKSIILGTQLLLAKLGIPSTIFEVNKRYKTVGTTTKRTYFCKPRLDLEVYSNELSRFIFDKEYIGNRKLHFQHVTDKFIFHRIRNIEEIQYLGTVYNLETSSSTFCINNVITHNSVSGLWPDGYKLSSGNEIELNPVQKELLRAWNSLYRDSGEYDTIILLGDIINGNNRKEFSKGLVTADLDEQKHAAIRLLKPFFKKFKNVSGYAVSSSTYHSSLDVELDADIIKHFHGQFGGAIANLNIKGTGKILNLRHGKGSLPVLISSKLEREVQFANISERLSKTPNVDIIALAHFHVYKRLDTGNKIIFTNPGFEAPRINIYSSPNWFKLLPDYGAIKLTINEKYIKVEPLLYDINLSRYYLEDI